LEWLVLGGVFLCITIKSVVHWSSLIIITSNIKPFFCMTYCSKKNVCWRSVPVRYQCLSVLTVRTLRHQSDGAELSWNRSVRDPKCLDTVAPMEYPRTRDNLVYQTGTFCIVCLIPTRFCTVYDNTTHNLFSDNNNS